jgi:protein-tyrosine phosphatase
MQYNLQAGHGRSAAVVYCYLVTQYPDMPPQDIARLISDKRKVRKGLHLQPTNTAFRTEFLRKREVALGND